jgi:EpsI family protein
MSQPTRVMASCALLVGTFVFLQLRSAGEPVPIRKPLDAFPTTLGASHADQETILDPTLVKFLGVTDYVLRRYVDGSGQSVWLYVGYWAMQHKGAGEIHSPKNCLPASGWEPVEASRMTITLPAPSAPIPVNRYLVQKEQEKQVVLYWYQSRGRATASEVAAKIELVRGAIVHNRTDGALVRLSSPVSGGVRETTQRLMTFVQTLHPLLNEYLPD